VDSNNELGVNVQMGFFNTARYNLSQNMKYAELKTRHSLHHKQSETLCIISSLNN